jgi:ketosteroid isomerase-like protein
MSDLQAIADRVEIEALRDEFADAGMMRDHDRVASLFTQDGVWRIPDMALPLKTSAASEPSSRRAHARLTHGRSGEPGERGWPS